MQVLLLEFWNAYDGMDLVEVVCVFGPKVVVTSGLITRELDKCLDRGDYHLRESGWVEEYGLVVGKVEGFGKVRAKLVSAPMVEESQ